MSYRPEIKIDNQGGIRDFPLDAETVKGKQIKTTINNSDDEFPTSKAVKTFVEEKNYGTVKTVNNASPDANGNVTLTINNNNQKIKAGNVTFGENDVVNINAGPNVTISGSPQNKEITITSDNDNQKIKTGLVTFGSNDTVEIVAGDNIIITGSANNSTIEISVDDAIYESKSAAQNGTDLSLVTTGEKYNWNNKADEFSPSLRGTPTAPTASAGTNNTQIATTEFVMNAFAANDAMLFKGTIGTSGSGATVTVLPAKHYKGWTYKVATAGTYAGKNCEIGDMIICQTDGYSNNNDHWTVVQSNIDGAVIGPTSSTNMHIAVFDGTTGKLIKDSGFTTSSFLTS